MGNDVMAVVMAAGKGTRMKSKKSKKKTQEKMRKSKQSIRKLLPSKKDIIFQVDL